MDRVLLLGSVALLSACRSDHDPRPIPIAATALAVGETTVEVTFTRDVDPESVDPNAMAALSIFDRPMSELPILDVSVDGPTLSITTGRQAGGVPYALTLGDLEFQDVDAPDYPRQVSFHGYGRTSIVLALDARGFIPPPAITALVTVDPATGDYSDRLVEVPLVEANEIWTATVTARVLPSRVFAARAVGSDGAPAAELVTFRVSGTEKVRVDLDPVLEPVPEFSAPLDDVAGDGFAPVRIILDDRPSRSLERPELRMSLDAAGRFDLASNRLEPLARVAGKGRVYEAVVSVAVDPSRTADGTTPSTFPYVVFLVEGGVDVAQRGATFVLGTETPLVVVIPIGNPALVPVTFRADAGSAILEPDGSQRGLYAGEGVFLTGEFPNAEDGLGRIAADAFTGGERATLEMIERPDAPGIYEKTIFLPPARPYGWKVLRCPTGQGCAELNRHVLSSGRAFPTVMKNLVTENVDAAQSPAVELLDPASLGAYAGARVSLDGTEPKSTAIMFKQEVPDLVVTVGTEPVITAIVVIGTWRDVNIPETPDEIIRSGATLDLTPFDYDDGTQGRNPLIRDLDLPIDPGEVPTIPGVPAFDASNGARDAAALDILGGAISAAWNERELYVSTRPAVPGRDHFVVISADPPSSSREAHWAKQGRITVSSRTVMLAMEGDGSFAGWFRLRGTSATDELLSQGVTSSMGAVLEGAIDLGAAGLGGAGDRIWIGFAAYASADGGALSEQSPAGNMNLDLEASELLELELATVRP